jgi:hypothetical protein
MFGNRVGISVVFAAVAAAMAVPCCASTIPPAVFSGDLYFDGNGPSTNGPGTFIFGAGSNFIAATLLYRNGEASISASGSNFTNFTQGTNPSIAVSFAVIGSISEAVPLIVTGAGSASQTGAESSVDAGVSLSGSSPVVNLSACSEGAFRVEFCNAGEPSSFSSTVDVNVTSNTIYQIYVSINGGSSEAALGDTWSASVDEQVAIDPSFAGASDFALEFSPNLPAPEASSMQLLLAGCLALGAMAWFRSARTRRALSRR